MSNEISYEWEVQGFYAGYWECLTTEDTKDEAVFQKQCYDENECGVPHRIKRVRVQIVGMKFEYFNRDRQRTLITHSGISVLDDYEKGNLQAMKDNGYKFKVDGKTVSLRQLVKIAKEE